MFRRIIFTILMSGALCFGLAATVLLFPQFMFAHNIEHQNVRVYAAEEIDESISEAIDQAIALIAVSEIYDPEYAFDVFLANNTIFNDIDGAILGQWPAARATHNNVVVKAPLDLAAGVVLTERSRINFVYLLAHEMTHCLQANHFGMLTFNPLSHPPMWKLEGYPEYVARKPMLKETGYELKHEVDRFLSISASASDGWALIDQDHYLPLIYYKGRLMVEYLADVRGMSYVDIIKDNRTEAYVWEEVIAWRQSLSNEESITP